MTIQRKVLVLVDGSERAIQTINYVKDFMPPDKDMRIVLFHVFSGIPEEYRELAQEPSFITVVDQLKNRETQEKRKLRACLEQAKNILISGGFSELSIEVKFHSLEKGVARDIIDEARNGYLEKYHTWQRCCQAVTIINIYPNYNRGAGSSHQENFIGRGCFTGFDESR